jgi:chromosome segregation ATPase
MNKTILCLLLSFVLGGTLLAGLSLSKRGGSACPTCPILAGELTAVQQSLTALREETAALRDEIHRYQSTPPALAKEAVGSPPAAPEAAAAKPAGAAAPEAIKTGVLLALAEDREQREAQRQEEREKARQAAEQRRQEREALQAGPYDRFNLKVNSLGKVLQLTDAQKQAYYEAITASRDKLKESLKQAAQAAGAAGAEGQTAEGGRGRGREAWGKMREASEAAQQELEQSLATIFTPSQLETYNQLSRSDRDMQDLGEVNPPGQENGESRRSFGFQGGGSGRGAGPGGGGRGGGRGGPGSGGR